LEKGETPPPSVARAAYWLNNLQPFMALVFIAATRHQHIKSFSLLLAAVAPFLYTGAIMANAAPVLEEQVDIRPEQDCDHLDLFWWRDKRIEMYFPLYLIGVMSAIFLLPGNQRCVHGAILLGTLILSSVLYKCGQPSLWCWSIASAGFGVLIK
jgi:hypothetical protein